MRLSDPRTPGALRAAGWGRPGRVSRCSPRRLPGWDPGIPQRLCPGVPRSGPEDSGPPILCCAPRGGGGGRASRGPQSLGWPGTHLFLEGKEHEWEREGAAALPGMGRRCLALSRAEPSRAGRGEGAGEHYKKPRSSRKNPRAGSPPAIRGLPGRPRQLRRRPPPRNEPRAPAATETGTAPQVPARDGTGRGGGEGPPAVGRNRDLGCSLEGCR